MSQIEILNRMLCEMNHEIDIHNEFINEKERLTEHMVNKISELGENLVKEQEFLNDSIKKRDKLICLKDEVNTNYKQIDDGVNTLVDILKSKHLN